MATGQPTEIYLDDSRSGERVADVYEVESISYPIDEEEIVRRLGASGKRKLVYTDGQIVHFFKLVAGTATEIAITPSDTNDMSTEIKRILSVYRRNSRFNSESNHLDILKGLILFTHGANPSSREDAEETLSRIFAESSVDLDPGIEDWEPLDHALKSLVENCPDAEPGDLGSAYLDVFKRETYRVYDFIGSDVFRKVFSSLVETPCSMYHLIPHMAVALPYGSIVHAYAEGGEAVKLICVLMGVQDMVDVPTDMALTGTVAAFDYSGRGDESESTLASLVDRVPENGKMVIVHTGGILFNMRGKPLNSFIQRIRSHHLVLHYLKALFLQPQKFLFMGIFKIHAVRPNQGKRKEMHAPLCGDLIIQLAHRAAAQISRILITGVRLGNLLVDPLKLLIANHCLPTENQFSLKRNF